MLLVDGTIFRSLAFVWDQNKHFPALKYSAIGFLTQQLGKKTLAIEIMFGLVCLAGKYQAEKMRNLPNYWKHACASTRSESESCGATSI